MLRFLELFEAAEAAGLVLAERYRSDGDSHRAHKTLGQVSWLRSRHDLVLDGRLLPGSEHPFSLTRMFADFFHHGEDGKAFENACAALEDYWWEDQLGVPDWNWQAGLPPGWAELAARTPRVRDDWQPAKPRPRGWRRLLGAKLLRALARRSGPVSLHKPKVPTTDEWNDLERCLHLAADLGDDAKLLRALARNVVYLTQPPTGAEAGSVELFRNPPRPLPLVNGVDDRTYVLVFTSFRALAQIHPAPDVTWTMVPTGILAEQLPPDTPVLLGGEGQSVVVEPDDMRTIALLFARANVREAFQPGPATPVGLKGAGDRAGRLLRRPPPGCGRAPRDHGRRLGTGTTRRARSARLAGHRSYVRRRRRGRRGDATGCEVVRFLPGQVRRAARASAGARARRDRVVAPGARPSRAASMSESAPGHRAAFAGTAAGTRGTALRPENALEEEMLYAFESRAVNPAGELGFPLRPEHLASLVELPPPDDGESAYLLGEPKEEPTELLDAMRRLADSRDDVRALYRALLVRAPGASPEHLVGIEVAARTDPPSVVDAAFQACRASGVERAGFVPIQPGLDSGSVGRFMLEKTEPFWTRKVQVRPLQGRRELARPRWRITSSARTSSRRGQCS